MIVKKPLRRILRGQTFGYTLKFKNLLLEPTQLVELVLYTDKLGGALHGSEGAEADFDIVREDVSTVSFNIISAHSARLADGFLKIDISIKDSESLAVLKTTLSAGQIGTYNNTIQELSEVLDIDVQLFNRVMYCKDGADGKSAYQIALENGFVGSEWEWLESLKVELRTPVHYNSMELAREVPHSGETVQRHLEQVHKNLEALKEFEVTHKGDWNRDTLARIGGIDIDYREPYPNGGGTTEFMFIGGFRHEITRFPDGSWSGRIGGLDVDVIPSNRPDGGVRIAGLELARRDRGGNRFLNDMGEYHPVLEYKGLNGSQTPLWQVPNFTEYGGGYRAPASPYRVLDHYVGQLMPGEERRDWIQLNPRFEQNYDVATVNLFNPDRLVQKHVTVAIGMGSNSYGIEIIVTNHSEIEQVHGVHVRGVAIGY